MVDITLLGPHCRSVAFEPGDVLRHKGQHYTDMYVITGGAVSVDREAKGVATIPVGDPGAPIGEIAFLRGCPATATVTASAPTRALVIDDPTLARLERELPSLAADFLRDLARVAEERTTYNLVHTPGANGAADAATIDVLLCRTPEMIENAQRLRYEVYCEELQRQSPYADHGRRILADSLDDHGHTFVAVEGGEPVGTLRLNLATDGPLGLLEDLYGMRASAHHPRRTAVCTKFIVKKAKRGGATSLKLIAAVAKFGLRNSIREGYIDCIPALLPYYKALGFVQTGPQFLHRENGPSRPMKLDLDRHGKKLATKYESGGVGGLFLKATLIRLRDAVLGERSPTESREARR
ncbi:MAG: cyclic nucleotide-binding domain-containing protein [Vicinamibacterales bacterium]